MEFTHVSFRIRVTNYNSFRNKDCWSLAQMLLQVRNRTFHQTFYFASLWKLQAMLRGSAQNLAKDFVCWQIFVKFAIRMHNKINFRGTIFIFAIVFNKMGGNKISPHFFKEVQNWMWPRVFMLGKNQRQFWNNYWIRNQLPLSLFYFLSHFLLIFSFRSVTQIFIK